jgi:hypothetical protein
LSKREPEIQRSSADKLYWLYKFESFSRIEDRVLAGKMKMAYELEKTVDESKSASYLD